MIEVDFAYQEQSGILTILVKGIITHKTGLLLGEHVLQGVERFGSHRILVDLRRARNTSPLFENYRAVYRYKEQHSDIARIAGPLRIAFLTDPDDSSHDLLLAMLATVCTDTHARLHSKDEESARGWLLWQPGSSKIENAAAG
ncbi:hypothetical protein AU468_13350 [Alkalispirochaeta sphaeroplastigenens]|uniref:STAS/SEC14 domain-containing protein n=1 Tax=Alkalispirochaeta sphaeroplastigenens TaxID=1187066 RepID=A0A2S4JG72_9SPIO|nr:hypothetical protein [Alkalispirochaeta sphaeroplastigenens]POQ98564.1 hypothetical protein AU468_13350 [Alkalispirochaeta sphaeroplastigenens]